MRYIEGVNRKRKLSFPEYIDDYITEDNPVRVIDAFVDSLNMVELGFESANPPTVGRPGYDPRVLLKLYLYGEMNRNVSSRKLESETYRNIELMWLLRMLKPDHKVIADFRKENRESIKKVFRQFVALCKQWDLFGAEVIAVDGSKFRASNSKRNNFNEKNLARRIKYIDEKVEKYLTELDENDECDQRSRKPSSQEIKEKVKELEKRKEQYEKYQQELKEEDISEISLTDLDARLMSVNNNGVDICYNVQTVVDSKHKLIVDCDVINNPSDQGQLSEMSKKAMSILEVDNIKALADKGYYNAEDLKVCEKGHITTYVAKQVFSNATGEREFYLDKFKYDKERNVYICPAGHELVCTRKKAIDETTERISYKNKKACKSCSLRDKCTKSKDGREINRSVDQDFLDIVDKRTAENKELYKTRQMIVEHPFGTIKRGWGFSYFLTRGIESVKTEASLTFLAYDMKRVINILGVKEILKRLKEKIYSSNLFNLHINNYCQEHRVCNRVI